MTADANTRRAPATPPGPSPVPPRLVRGARWDGAATTWALCSAILLAGVFPFALILMTGPPPNLPWQMAWVISAVAGCAYAAIIGWGEPRLYEMTFWLFVYVFLGLAPLVQMRVGAAPSTTPDAFHHVGMATWLVVIAGLVAFCLGALIGRRDSPTSAAPPIAYRLDPRAVYWATALAFVITGYYIFRVGPASLFSSRQDLFARQVAVWPDPSQAALFVAAGSLSLLVAVAALVQVRKTQRTFTNLAALWLAVIMLLVVVNPLSSPRYVFGTVALGLAAVAGAFGSSLRFRLCAIGVVIAMIAVFPYADRFRYTEASGGSEGGPTKTLLSGDFDSFAQITNAVEYEEAHGSTHGRQALGVLLFWVPRGMWEDKPQDTGILLAEDRGYHFTNLSAPLWAEFLVNGGWGILVLGMAGFGCLVRRLDDGRIRIRGHGTVLANIAPFYMIIMLRGSFLQATLKLAVLVAMARIATYRRTPSHGR